VTNLQLNLNSLSETSTNIALGPGLAGTKTWSTNLISQVTRLGGTIYTTNGASSGVQFGAYFTNFFTPAFTNIPSVILGGVGTNTTGDMFNNAYPFNVLRVTTNYFVGGCSGNTAGAGEVDGFSWIVLPAPGQ
jgi:hypothetical protein